MHCRFASYLCHSVRDQCHCYVNFDAIKVLYQCVSVYICNILPAISYFFVNLLLLFCFNCNGRYGHRVLPVLVAEFTSQVFINVAPFTCSYMAARFCCKMFLCSMLALYLCKCSSNFIFA